MHALCKINKIRRAGRRFKKALLPSVGITEAYLLGLLKRACTVYQKRAVGHTAYNGILLKRKTYAVISFLKLRSIPHKRLACVFPVAADIIKRIDLSGVRRYRNRGGIRLCNKIMLRLKSGAFPLYYDWLAVIQLFIIGRRAVFNGLPAAAEYKLFKLKASLHGNNAYRMAALR